MNKNGDNFFESKNNSKMLTIGNSIPKSSKQQQIYNLNVHNDHNIMKNTRNIQKQLKFQKQQNSKVLPQINQKHKSIKIELPLPSTLPFTSPPNKMDICGDNSYKNQRNQRILQRNRKIQQKNIEKQRHFINEPKKFIENQRKSSQNQRDTDVFKTFINTDKKEKNSKNLNSLKKQLVQVQIQSKNVGGINKDKIMSNKNSEMLNSLIQILKDDPDSKKKLNPNMDFKNITDKKSQQGTKDKDKSNYWQKKNNEEKQQKIFTRQISSYSQFLPSQSPRHSQRSDQMIQKFCENMPQKYENQFCDSPVPKMNDVRPKLAQNKQHLVQKYVGRIRTQTRIAQFNEFVQRRQICSVKNSRQPRIIYSEMMMLAGQSGRKGLLSQGRARKGQQLQGNIQKTSQITHNTSQTTTQNTSIIQRIPQKESRRLSDLTCELSETKMPKKNSLRTTPSSNQGMLIGRRSPLESEPSVMQTPNKQFWKQVPERMEPTLPSTVQKSIGRCWSPEHRDPTCATKWAQDQGRQGQDMKIPQCPADSAQSQATHGDRVNQTFSQRTNNNLGANGQSLIQGEGGRVTGHSQMELTFYKPKDSSNIINNPTPEEDNLENQ